MDGELNRETGATAREGGERREGALGRQEGELTREAIRALLLRMPKAELHLHLDGSLRPATALELARERGLDNGLDLDGMRDRLTAPERCADQAELLRAFDLPIAIMQDAESLQRVAAELVWDVASDGTRYAEIRWAPALHTAKGLSMHDVVDAVVRGVAHATQSTADSGASPPTIRLIAVAIRTHDPETSRRVATTAADFLGRGVTGFDLAGVEAAMPDPLEHREAFIVARSMGLGITLHAGESGGPQQVRQALELRPMRIAHGAVAADDPELVMELIRRDVTLDLAPTSNVQAGIYPDVAEHPLARLLRAGVPLTLSTDDRTVSTLTLPREYGRVRMKLGLSFAELWRMNRRAVEVAFLHDDEKARDALRQELDEFERTEPLMTAA
jgi:adenosine deaminase